MILDSSGELFIQRHAGGILMSKPAKVDSGTSGIRLSSLMNLPCSVYFMDTQSAGVNINEYTAIANNISSMADCIGRTARDFAQKDVAEFTLSQDRTVMKSRAMTMEDHLYTRLDGASLPILTIKFPWYSINNKIMGILGLSIIIDKKWGHSLSRSLELLTQTGLLGCNKMQINNLPGFEYLGIYFTDREKDVVQQLIRGKTAKAIAETLGLSRRTVEDYIDKIKIKTNSNSKFELVEKMLDQFTQ